MQEASRIQKDKYECKVIAVEVRLNQEKEIIQIEYDKLKKELENEREDFRKT